MYPYLSEIIRLLANDQGFVRLNDPDWPDEDTMQDICSMSLDQLEALAKGMSEEDRVTFTMGDYDSSLELIEQDMRLVSLYCFIEEAFDGDLYKNFFQQDYSIGSWEDPTWEDE